MLNCTNTKASDQEEDYTMITKAHELRLQEKNDLIFMLMEHANLCVMRAKFDSSITILTSK